MNGEQTQTTSEESQPTTSPESTTEESTAQEKNFLETEEAKSDESADAKPEDQQGQEEREGKAGSQVPEKYEFKPPEGVQELPEEFVGQFSEAAKNIGLSQEQAQKALEVYLKTQQEEIAKAEQEVQRQIEEWAEETRKMWGASFEEKKAVAAKAYSEVVREIPEVREVIDAMGLGTHPAILKLFYRIGQLTQEDQFVAGKHAAPTKNEEELLKKMYPTTAEKR